MSKIICKAIHTRNYKAKYDSVWGGFRTWTDTARNIQKLTQGRHKEDEKGKGGYFNFTRCPYRFC